MTAALLADAGYDVVGITLQLYDHGAATHRKGACCAGRDIHDARAVAERIGIPHYVLDYAAPQPSRFAIPDLARHAEKWGYKRYWLAENHNMPGIASAATAVIIGYVAGGTSTIRVGAGGVCCPITRRWSSPSNSGRWNRFIRDESISAWDARRAPISKP